MICLLPFLKNDGAERAMEREQVITCTAGSNLLCATEQKTASIGLGRGGWRTSAMCELLIHAWHLFAARFSIPASHHRMRAFPCAVSLWYNQKNRRTRITPRGIPGGERLSAHAR